MRILFFGRLADSFGRTVELDAPTGCTIADLRALLVEKFPDAAEQFTAPAVRACVGDMLVVEDFRIEPGQEVEFWPPVSGG